MNNLELIQIYGEEGDTLALVLRTDLLEANNIPFRIVDDKVFLEIEQYESNTFIGNLLFLNKLRSKV
jgi:hypothetical protein